MGSPNGISDFRTLEPFLGCQARSHTFKSSSFSVDLSCRPRGVLPSALCRSLLALGVCAPAAVGCRWYRSEREWHVSHRIFGTVERSVRRWVPTSARTMAAPYGARRACPADLKKWAERIVRRWMMRCRVPRRCNWPTQRRAHGPFMPAIPARFIRLRCSAPSSLQRQVLVSES